MWARVALKPRFRLATFDVTNTLLRFRASVGEEYARVANTHGANCDPKKIESVFKTHFKLLSQKYPNYGRDSGITSEEWWKMLVCKSLSQSHPMQFSRSQLAMISEELFQLYTTDACYRLPKGITEQLKLLQERNVVLGVISNFDDRLNSLLVSTGLREFFQFVLSSYVEGVEKPDRRIFDLALSKVGSLNIGPSEAVHIGDNMRLDYQAAKSAGWSAYLLSHMEDTGTVHSPAKDSVIKVNKLSHYITEPLDE